jgi:hypothetical protein
MGKNVHLIPFLRVADRGRVGLPAFAPGEGDQQDVFADHPVHRRTQHEFHGMIDEWRDSCWLGHFSLFLGVS